MGAEGESTGAAAAALKQGYYDGAFSKEAVYVLQRATENGKDKPGSYEMQQSIGYVAKDGRKWKVPAEPGKPFKTDLASIPTLASWLVPKDGSHTPAALIHDAMVLGKDEKPVYEPHDPEVTREEADALFREGMQFLGVRFLRRWMMWAAVSIPTYWMLKDRKWPRRALIAVGLAVFVIIGLFGVPDVFDVPGAVTVPDWVPVAGDRILAWSVLGVEESSFLVELARFLGVVAVTSVVYAILWTGRRWRFGLTLGLALSLLSFPLAITAFAFVIYGALEEAIAFGLLKAKKRAEDQGRDTGRVRASVLVQKAARTD